jgi:hypothetical protein
MRVLAVQLHRWYNCISVSCVLSNQLRYQKLLMEDSGKPVSRSVPLNGVQGVVRCVGQAAGGLDESLLLDLIVSHLVKFERVAETSVMEGELHC